MGPERFLGFPRLRATGRFHHPGFDAQAWFMLLRKAYRFRIYPDATQEELFR
ncbi:helix-turn-helix domain-containing protein [Bradyrhizobium manausense]|uniref:helix-turn-helix domain-containing protein n=1 Tax=Bradyrhizobium manausense TaxID=989370 RepID=UPI001BAB0997|nr:helix-turn-helix domain-containing protein [Bradyrhizobium manausense]